MRVSLSVMLWLCGMPICWAGRIAVDRDTGALIEYQSHATPGTLIQNAVASGRDASTVVEREISEAEWHTTYQTQVVQPAKQRAKEQERQSVVEIPLSDFGSGALSSLASQGFVIRAQKKRAD